MGSALVALVMAVGLLGVLVPLLPGTALILVAGLAWAVLVQETGTGRWVVVLVMTALLVAGIAAKSCRRCMQFTADIHACRARQPFPRAEARRSTVQVLQAVGLGILAELTAGLLMVGTWMVGVLVT